MDFLPNLWEESVTRMVDGLWALIAAAKSIEQEEENLTRFSELMDCIEKILKQQSQHKGGQPADVIQESFLGRLDEAVNSARKIIEEYKSKSSFKRFFVSSKVYSQLNQSSNEITDVLNLLRFSQITKALDINDQVDAMSHSLKVFRHRINTDAIRSSPAGAASSSRVFPIDTPEVQLTQHLQCSINVPLNFNYLCPLSGKIMEDPVSVSCNHTYERKEIENHFRSGHTRCIICDKKLSSTNGELDLKPNSTHRDTISEFMQRNLKIGEEMNAKEKLRDCTERISPYNVEVTIQALKDLQALMTKIPNCISEATESSCKLVPKLAELLKESGATTGATTGAVLQSLLLIARFSHKNKEIIGRGGVIKCLLKQDNDNEAVAIDVLLELSTNNNVASKIIEAKTSITRLVSLLDNPNPSLTEKAQAVLNNLPTDIDSTIKMAMSGYLAPFLVKFNSAGTSEESRAFMAEKLAQMQLTETAMCSLENELFITNLSVMLDCSLPAVKSASLKCIKRLTAFDGLRSWILSTGYTIPAALLCLIMDTASEKQWKEEALEILISLVDIDQPLEQRNQCLEMIYSCNRIQDMIEQIKTSNDEDQVLLMRLLMAIVQKSDTARDWVISNQNAMSCLYSSLGPDKNGEVRLNALKLISYIAGNNLIEIPLPPNPAMVTALCHIIAVLEKGGTDEEISMAANIVSHLPCGDRSINPKLQNSSVLEALKIHISDANKSNEFLENALGALLRCMDRSNSWFLMQFGKLEQPIVQILSIGSPLAKQRAATILAHLARCAPESSAPPSTSTHFRWPTWPFSSSTDCTVHKSRCSLQRTVCLAKAGVVRPLVLMVDTMNPDAAEAALAALQTLFDTGNLETRASETSFNNAAASVIVENKGMAAILAVLERGPVPIKKAALELIQKIYKHPDVTKEEFNRLKAILPHLLNEVELNNKARILISEMV